MLGDRETFDLYGGTTHGIQMVNVEGDMGKYTIIWHLSRRQAAKAQTNLRICAVLSEPALLAYTKYGKERGPGQKYLRVWMGGGLVFTIH